MYLNEHTHRTATLMLSTCPVGVQILQALLLYRVQK